MINKFTYDKNQKGGEILKSIKTQKHKSCLSAHLNKIIGTIYI